MESTKTILTRKLLDAAKPREKPYRLWDAKVPGLFLRVQPSGVKAWNVQWSRSTSIALGRYPVLTLDAARVRSLAILTDVAANGAPVLARPRAGALTLSAFLDDEFLPWAKARFKWAEGSCERIRSTFPDLLNRPMREVTAWQIEKWRTRRIEDGISANTCNRDIASLSSAFRKAVEWKFLQENPLAAVRPAKTDAIGVVRFLSAAEEARLREALSVRDNVMREARLRANAWREERGRKAKAPIAEAGYGDHLTPLVLTAMNSGLRRGELTSLKWADIDFCARSLAVRAGYAKSGKARYIPLNSESLKVLARWREQSEDEVMVFNLSDPKTAWSRVLKGAGIENFRFHDLRHHFASRLVMAGVDLNTVRELLGHADLKMTLRYAHLAPEHKAEAVERLAALRSYQFSNAVPTALS